MSKFKHTPGPWYAVGSLIESEDEDIPDICECHPAAFDQGHLPRSEQEIFANAKLIAAAPDLLKAVKLAIKAMESDEYEDLKYALDACHYAVNASKYRKD